MRGAHPGEGIEHPGKGRAAVDAQPPLDDSQFDLQERPVTVAHRQALDPEVLQALVVGKDHDLRLVVPRGGDKVGEGFQITDIGLQHHANAITLDVDLGNVRRDLGAGQIDPVSLCRGGVHQ